MTEHEDTSTADTERADALRQTDESAPLGDAELDEIRTRNRYLRTVPFETHGPSVKHSDGCPPCGMVRSISDVTRLLAALHDARKQLAAIDDYRIEADSDYSGERWLYIVHKTDSSQVHDTRYSGGELEDELDGAALMQAIEAHQRGEGGDRG